MGGCCSEPEDPLMAQYRAAKDYATKARIVLQVAGNEEKRGATQKAIILYGTHLRCMAVHCFKEFDRKCADELINVAQSCRRIANHRATLQHRAIRKAQESCCGSPYIPTDPAAPAVLAPWEWSEWLLMCKGSGDIEAALMKMGLLRIESRQTVALRLAEAARSNVNVALSQQCSPNISVSPTISGPTTTVNPNIVSSNAQTGEGNVTPAVGAGGDAGSSYASAPGAGGTAMAMPPAGYVMMPMQTPNGVMMVAVPSGGLMPAAGGSGAFMMPAGSGGSTPSVPGSGDYGAAMQQQQMLWQQQMAPGGNGTMPYAMPMPSPFAGPPGYGSAPGTPSGTLPPGMPAPMMQQQERTASAPSTPPYPPIPPAQPAQGVAVGKPAD